MANQLKTKFIGNDQVTSEKVLLQNNTALRSKDSSDVTQDILKLDATDKVIVYRSTGAEEIAYMSDVNSGGTALQDHIDDPTGAHAASAISVSAIANMAATDVQAALAELQGDIDSIDATYVNVSGDTMTGALTIDQNSVQLSLQSESISNNGSLSISGSTELMLDAGGGTGNVSVSADNIFIGTADIRNTQFDNIRIALNDVPSGSSIYMGADGGITTLQQERLVVKSTSGATGFEVSNVGTIEQVTLIRSGTSATDESRISFLGSTLELFGGSQAGSKISATTQLDMEGNKIVDVQQLENLSPGTMSGNTLRYDELGAYSISAGYGIATLNNAGKIPSSQLPNAIMEYQGTWNATTNTPTLADGSGANAPEDAGHVYKVSVGGTQDLGSGPIVFVAGDSIILNASLVWEKSADANLVYSVNGAQGIVVLDSEDLTYHQGNASDWTVADDSSIKLTLDEVGSRLTANEGDIAAVADDVSHLVTLSGVSVDSDNLGVFTGNTISNDQTVKSALQELETAHEAHLNDASDAHDASAISLSPAINGQTDVQSAMGDHETRIDALEAVVYAAPYKKTLVAGDITNGYIDLPFLAVQTNGMRVCVDRLQMHQGAAEDYTLSTVSGVTRITFLNDMVDPGPQKLAAGDNIYVVYQKNA